MLLKIQKDWKLRKVRINFHWKIVQNEDIEIDNVFVPDKNKLTNSKDFATGTNAILECTRLGAGWMIEGLAVGAY